MNSKVNQFTVESLLFVEKQCSWVTLAHNLHPHQPIHKNLFNINFIKIVLFVQPTKLQTKLRPHEPNKI